MIKYYCIFCCVFFLFVCHSSHSQDLDSLLNLNAFTQESDLQKILNKNVSVSTQKLTARETPGIISLITAEEIQNSGARDLIDVLRLVPGFDVMQDNQFVMGFALRGSWANEGKVLLLLDGVPFNELLYQSVSVGNRFAVDAVERIEIIRGPGSAVYGGSAEYGVINIITKAAESLNGVAVYGTGGFHSNAVGRTNGGIMASQKRKSFSWDFSLFKGKGIVSDQPYQDLYQENEEQNLAKTTYADPQNVNVGLQYKGLNIRTMYDVYKTSDPFTYMSSKTFFTNIQYDLKVSPKLSLTPQLRYMNQIPWSFGIKETGEDAFKIRAKRSQAQLSGLYTISRKTSLTFGGTYFHDQGIDLLTGDSFAGEKTIELDNYAVFAQGLFKHRLANATVGFRYEKNNRYGGAFVPRLALTKKIENLHFKILYSQAFRAPSIQNINLALTGKAKPEKSDVFEFEVGYQFTPEMLLSVNAFSITTKDVLIYGINDEGDNFEEWYENYSKSGSKGIELVYSIRKKTFYANLTYSFNQAISDNTVDTYEVPETKKQYVGLPVHKATLNTCLYLTPKLSFNPSFVVAGKRYAYTQIDSDGNPNIGQLESYVLVNTFVNYKLLTGLSLGVGVFDVLNEKPSIPQAYNGGYAPISGRSREYVVKLSYQLNFKK
jgi:outer membrane receptor for ferrienterochelin and colicin